ncbi:MAG: hypothetical protein GY861_22530 [bacterium]|nr:hypothetical protein [bacterium]
MKYLSDNGKVFYTEIEAVEEDKLYKLYQDREGLFLENLADVVNKFNKDSKNLGVDRKVDCIDFVGTGDTFKIYIKYGNNCLCPM